MARIVVVDDDRDFTDVMVEILQEDGHEVTSCNSSGGAVACVLSARPDLVLLDVRLDGSPEAGWTILDQLRGDARMATTPVIVSSAAMDALRAREAWLRERGIPVLPKPFDMDDLLRLVQEVIGDDGRAEPRRHSFTTTGITD